MPATVIGSAEFGTFSFGEAAVLVTGPPQMVVSVVAPAGLTLSVRS